MPEGTPPKNTASDRVTKHRRAAAARGHKRVEVVVPAADASLVRAAAAVLRAGGDEARAMRQTLSPLVASSRADSGTELVRFFRASPLTDLELLIERDRGSGRSADFD